MTMDKRQTAINPGSGGRQHGAVLVFCLVFLAILTLMGVSGMESTILEERMSGNMQDHNTAFQAAESALKVAEAWLAASGSRPATSNDGSTVVWTLDAMDPDTGDTTDWWSDSARDASWWTANAQATTGLQGVAAQAEYIIEEFSSAGNRTFHRITARGVGQNSLAAVKLQSVYAKAY